MAELYPITPLLTAAYKAVRLRALKDTPFAFGSTYERESQFSDEEWNARTAHLSGGRDIGFLALCDGKYAGLALCFIDNDDPLKSKLISMWVAPEVRRQGVGRHLIEAITAWAAERGVRTLHLMVTNINDAAIEFYRRNGFTETGKTEPYPNHPDIVEYEMTKAIG